MYFNLYDAEYSFCWYQSYPFILIGKQHGSTFCIIEDHILLFADLSCDVKNLPGTDSNRLWQLAAKEFRNNSLPAFASRAVVIKRDTNSDNICSEALASICDNLDPVGTS